MLKEKILDFLFNIAEEHPIAVPIMNSIIASFITCLLVNFFNG